MNTELDSLIDYCGSSVYHAIENRLAVIARRLQEGLESPKATLMLEALRALPSNYATPGMIQRQANRAASGGNND